MQDKRRIQRMNKIIGLKAVTVAIIIALLILYIRG